MLALMFAQGNDNPIFKSKPETHLVDNNMLVIGHGQFIIHIPQLKSCYVFISKYLISQTLFRRNTNYHFFSDITVIKKFFHQRFIYKDVEYPLCFCSWSYPSFIKHFNGNFWPTNYNNNNYSHVSFDCCALNNWYMEK